jgi:hypothetical protein
MMMILMMSMKMIRLKFRNERVLQNYKAHLKRSNPQVKYLKLLSNPPILPSIRRSQKLNPLSKPQWNPLKRMILPMKRISLKTTMMMMTLKID